MPVTAFSGDTQTDYHGLTDENGHVDFYPQPGQYLFRAEYEGEYFWSIGYYECNYPVCASDYIQVMPHVGTGQLLVRVVDTQNQPLANIDVLAELSGYYISERGVSNENGEALFSLEYGTYNLFADFENFGEWINDVVCNQPDCGSVTIMESCEQSSSGYKILARAKSIAQVYSGDAAPLAEHARSRSRSTTAPALRQPA
ncbi:MAG: hypothetical protein AB9891_12600 [Anaerolineaceae bacterium]